MSELAAPLRDAAAAFEAAALGPGLSPACPLVLAWDPATWASLVAARRLRVLEWIAGAGMSVLNVMPDVEETFLRVAAEEGLANKTAVAASLWRTLSSRAREISPWLELTGDLERLLLAARMDRARPVLAGDAPARLATGVFLARGVPDALAIHEELPSRSVPEAARAALLARALGRTPDGAPREAFVLAAAGIDAADGALFEVPDKDAEVLLTLASCPLVRSALRARVTPETFDALVDGEMLEGACA